MKPKKKVAKKIPYWKNKRWNVCKRKQVLQNDKIVKHDPNPTYKPMKPITVGRNVYMQWNFPAPHTQWDTSESESED
jgi:hypothetical protein